MKLPSLFEVARNEGIAIGEARGRDTERQIIRDKLIAYGMSPLDASNITGLSLDEAQKL